ncbi:MAG: sigma factor, partial [Opitutaceae bacterium]
MIDDAELLRRYARDRSEEAFAELVQRHAGLVYSAALRQVGGDAQLAQDVSQNVFIDLARKAGALTDRPMLASWLYTSTRFAALKALRTKQRREIREQEAYIMQEIERAGANEADWEKLRPLLDGEMCDLSALLRARTHGRRRAGRKRRHRENHAGDRESILRRRKRVSFIFLPASNSTPMNLVLPLAAISDIFGLGAIAIVGIVSVVFLFVIVWATRYTKVGPNQVLIVSGRTHRVVGADGKIAVRGFRVVKGGGTFIIPVVEKADVLSLELLTIDVQTPEVYTSKG